MCSSDLAEGGGATRVETLQGAVTVRSGSRVLRLRADEGIRARQEDLMVTLTYGEDWDADEGRHDFTRVQRDVRNFIRRVRSARERAGLDELRYVYSIEGFRGEEAEDSEAPALPGVLEAAPEVIERKGGVSPRPHVHMILSGGLELRSAVARPVDHGQSQTDAGTHEQEHDEGPHPPARGTLVLCEVDRKSVV